MGCPDTQVSPGYPDGLFCLDWSSRIGLFCPDTQLSAFCPDTRIRVDPQAPGLVETARIPGYKFPDTSRILPATQPRVFKEHEENTKLRSEELLALADTIKVAFGSQ